VKRVIIFLPDHLHEQLRREAFRLRQRMTYLIRSRLEETLPHHGQSRPQGDPLTRVAGICRGPVFSTSIDEETTEADSLFIDTWGWLLLANVKDPRYIRF
jgi:hypothetical protein